MNEIPRRFSIGHYTAFRSILLGAGLAYAVSEEKYFHVPVVVFLPSIYAGYQAYKNKEAVADWTRVKLR